MEKLIKYLWGLFLFTFPFSVRWIVYEPASYRFGQFNPWVTGFVYLPEILLGLIFVLWVIRKIVSRDYGLSLLCPPWSAQAAGTRYGWLWVLFILFAVNAYAVTLLNGDALLGAVFLLRLSEALAVFWLVSERVLEPRQVIKILLFGALFQIIWGFLQFRANHDLGLSFMGESRLSPDLVGVAKNDLPNGTKQIRSYGSFLHPNILGVYLLVIFFLSLKYLKYGSKLFWFPVFIIGVYFSGSQGAMLAGVAGTAVYFLFKFFRAQPFRRSVALMILLFLVFGNLWFFNKSAAVQTRDVSFRERLSQNVISHNMWKANPFGVGVRNFTLEMEQYTSCDSPCELSDEGLCETNCLDRKLLPWEFQPVHNTFFLILNETGIQGLLLLILFLLALFDLYWKEGTAVPILAVLLIASFDHFLWDGWISFILIALCAGFFVIENESHHSLFAAQHDD